MKRRSGVVFKWLLDARGRMQAKKGRSLHSLLAKCLQQCTSIAAGRAASAPGTCHNLPTSLDASRLHPESLVQQRSRPFCVLRS